MAEQTTIENEELETAEAAETTETTDTVAEAAAETAEAPAEPTVEEKLQKQLDELNDRYVRMAAEYDNFRKRTAKEREAVRAETLSKALAGMLPVYDHLTRAVAQETEDAEYKKGVEMTLNQFVDCLKALGVTVIPAERGTTFDPALHQAVMHVEDETLGENQIAAVFQAGFLYGERVIRTAMVQVAN